jgi:hypothetical protein
MRCGVRPFVVVCLVVAVAGAPLSAQLSTAELAGTVRDASGAVLPGVAVTVTQTDTGFTRTVTSNEEGASLLPNLPPGPYRLEVALQGFRTYVQTGIVRQVGATPTIDPVPGLGGAAETVTVDAAAPLVDERGAGIGEVIENERIVELPLQGRQVTSRLVLAGAALDPGATNDRGTFGRITSIAGDPRIRQFAVKYAF